MRGFPLFYGQPRRNQPERVQELQHRERYYEPPNKPAEDGYTRLSAADRETGNRPQIGGVPVPSGTRLYED